MEQVDFHQQAVPDAQFFTGIEQSINFIESSGFYGDEEDIDYLLMGLKNTLKHGLDIK
jgi:hypothetical protein